MAIDRDRLRHLLARETSQAAARNPRSHAAYQAAGHLFGRVPMTWMNKNAAAFPLYLRGARGARVEDIDGHAYVDFCLGDTGAMAGHSPAPVAAAVDRRYREQGGATAMLPTEDAEWVGAELTRRFGLPRWSFSLTATDANRWAIRLARAVTGRPKILVNSYCYHGSVDESLIVTGPDGRVEARRESVMSETKVIPVLPLRDIVVFPRMVVPLFVGRDKSVRALDEVMRGDKQILLATQKNSADDEPQPDAIYEVGVLATVLQLLKLPDGTVKVLVEGKSRARIARLYAADIKAYL